MDGTKWTMKKILNDNYKCEGQMSIFDFIDKPKDEEAKAAAPVEDFMNPPEEAAKAAVQKPDYNLSGDPDYHGALDEIRRLTIENDFERSIKLFNCKCGKKPERLFKGCHEYFVRCPKCRRETEHFSKMYKAMQAWNNGRVQEPKEAPICKHSKHTCNKKELWKIADSLDELQCPHVCCRMCNTRNCGARCNGSEEPKKEITDDYIKENPTCFYVFGHYLDKADGWHKVPEELPTFTEWTTIDVVIFGKKTSTSWMEHEKWEAKDWSFRSKDVRRDTESTQILAWKISEDANKEIANE